MTLRNFEDILPALGIHRSLDINYELDIEMEVVVAGAGIFPNILSQIDSYTIDEQKKIHNNDSSKGCKS